MGPFPRELPGRLCRDSNWAAIRLNDGSEIMAASICNGPKKEGRDQWLIIVDCGGEPTAYSDIKLEPVHLRHSARTIFDYPTSWRLDAPKAGVALKMHARIGDREVLAFASERDLHGGLFDVEGMIRGKPVTGLAYMEQNSSERVKEGYFSRVGEERSENRPMLPVRLDPKFEESRELVLSKELGR
jgi:hypothetical protein